MHYDQIAQIAAVIIGVGSISISGILWNIVKAYKERTEQLEGIIHGYEDDIKACKMHHTENEQKISVLEGQLKSYEGLALVPMQFIKDQQKTQKEIIRVLKQIEINQPNNLDKEHRER